MGIEMNLKSISLLLLPALLALLLACGAGSQIADTQIPETKVVAKVEVAPSPTQETPKPEPTKPATPKPSATKSPSTATPISPTQTPQSSGLTFSLKISEIAADLLKYDRGDWKHWIDEDRDCQNTRHEVLIEESLKEVTFKSAKQCQVATGEWLDPYTGDTVTDATKLDVDHMIPLKNAHDSGGWAWDKDKKAAYANEMGYSDHLIAVTASANRKKGARGPEEYKPANQDYWCDYAIDWVQIKVDWELSATQEEWTALQKMLETCDSPPSITAIRSKAQPPLAATPVLPVATPVPSVEPGVADMLITSLDCKGKPEIVVIENAGTSAQDMTGWKVEDRGSKNTFNFPAGFSLEPGSSVELVSGAAGVNTGETIFWNNRTVWNNDGDTASLFDSSGQLASEMKCP